MPSIHKKNTRRNHELVIARFLDQFRDRGIHTITSDEILSFLTKATQGNKQTTKRNRYACLKALFNFIRNTSHPELHNPCDSSILKKLFKNPPKPRWPIFEKETVDEIIFRTENSRNRLILELMARGGMRIGEVLKLKPFDVDGQRLILENPRSGREAETVFIPQKVAERLRQYIRHKAIDPTSRIFPITYAAGLAVVKKAGKLVGVNLRPHDLRRHAATYASRAGTPIEIVSKVILRHANLSTTQRYLGKVSDAEALRWIDNLHG